ncbi:methylated-DNA--[protein]-cysteine S-methyltransferase [Clostridium tertium]|jgi:methylated-DNA-[protein]-cysteine S-methyltransferase|uniref:methylated-DNA--[protein]-cysteine S-methyltransferase n=2 Tax=Clostridium tertium TaxID=1559 RepID=UPI000BE3603A|nr:methylated-DNA--[protein]-cysteine S-methyltransferase [Clostridium tertium]MBU6136599.1 methylated-DNA--[protein]-cysteine S-methyltransferase [Clostridium tertium]MDB1942481.1 methylated-DNA--[protein]-cysteine S-methyltransferase [Clostridium tertium]MDB1954575.1 methylated-DNA--[protein]-cysteine S-methyltransferase [Clostridium tertium]MDB1957722.1 methylated-DNA--[protein]-cysteine S-methyltransferase [Clostridium tertium]MDB1960858.1 methylated-DNA--[protein]-cysteine S-methyltransfe
MKSIFYYETIIGEIGIADNGKGITNIYIKNKLKIEKDIEIRETKLIKEAANQLNEYFSGERINFSISLDPEGTEFQHKVWNELIKIPYGETRTYKEIAEKIGNSKAARAIGMANNKNPILMMIPCHRVVGKNKSLVGYAGGLEMKERLLEIENQSSLH